jgi:hypothetical protein
MNGAAPVWSAAAALSMFFFHSKWNQQEGNIFPNIFSDSEATGE